MRFLLVSLSLLLLSACGDKGSEAVHEESAGTQYAHTNHLIHEKSPYLLQHAHNPVNWYPWGPEALEKARREDKPIFLSIGYSTCHWCHVMERESFENEEIAALLNRYFVAIKVDREERPDLDHLYMNAVQSMTGRGGWPMSVFLTPDRKPFYAGTYFPPHDRQGMPGFQTILETLSRAWREDRAHIVDRGNRVAAFLREQAQAGTKTEGARLDADLLDRTFHNIRATFDAERGGFGGAPKFPTPHKLGFLLRYANRTGNTQALDMAVRTLDAMAAGGIHDHLGGGFHRYSTDAQWLVPHFEKMLYDQAGLALVYTDAFLVTRDPRYRAVAEDVLDYMVRDLGHPDGGFYSAEDADSEGKEGTFYLWDAAEVDSVLGADEGEAFRRAYGVTARGNFEGRNILHRPFPDDGSAVPFAEARRLLLEVRGHRPRPHRDEKIITAWNGFAIEALAHAGSAFDRSDYVEQAARAATFIETHLWKNGRLLRHYRDGAADVPAYLDDYVYLGRGLLTLFKATQDPRWLGQALSLAAETDRLFARESGGYRINGQDGDSLLTPVVDTYDGALPSGNSVAADFLSRLGHLVGDAKLEGRGWNVLQTFSEDMSNHPGSHLEMLSALDFALGPKTEVVIAGAPDDPKVAAMRNAVAERYLPRTVVVYRPAKGAGDIVSLVPYVEAQGALDGNATGYVCRDYACRLPVHDAEGLVRQLTRP